MSLLRPLQNYLLSVPSYRHMRRLPEQPLPFQHQQTLNFFRSLPDFFLMYDYLELPPHQISQRRYLYLFLRYLTSPHQFVIPAVRSFLARYPPFDPPRDHQWKLL